MKIDVLGLISKLNKNPNEESPTKNVGDTIFKKNLLKKAKIEEEDDPLIDKEQRSQEKIVKILAGGNYFIQENLVVRPDAQHAIGSIFQGYTKEEYQFYDELRDPKFKDRQYYSWNQDCF